MGTRSQYSQPVTAPQAGRELRSHSPPHTSFSSFISLSPNSLPVCWSPWKAYPPRNSIPEVGRQGEADQAGASNETLLFPVRPVPLPEAIFAGVSAAGRPVSCSSFQPPTFSSSHLLHEAVLGGAGPVLPWVTFPKALELLGLNCTPLHTLRAAEAFAKRGL